jgi:uncharacterized membrane protein
MVLYLLALLIGVVAGLRSMTAPAAVSWAAYLGFLDLGASWLAFLGYRFTPWIVTLLAFGELIADKLPSTPSRKLLVPFATRIIMGGASGMAIGMPNDALGGMIAGAIGAVIGTLGGAAARARLASFFGNDTKAALTEDFVAIFGAILIIGAVT